RRALGAAAGGQGEKQSGACSDGGQQSLHWDLFVSVMLGMAALPYAGVNSPITTSDHPLIRDVYTLAVNRQYSNSAVHNKVINLLPAQRAAARPEPDGVPRRGDSS